MLLLCIHGVSAAVQVVQTEILGNEIDSLTKGKLIEEMLEMAEEVMRIS